MNIKTFAVIIAFVLAFMFPFMGMRTENADYGFYVSEEESIKKCPPLEYTLLTTDTDELLVMESLYNWYIDNTGREKYFKNHDLVLLVSPFIFKIYEEKTKNIFIVFQQWMSMR